MISQGLSFHTMLGLGSRPGFGVNCLTWVNWTNKGRTSGSLWLCFLLTCKRDTWCVLAPESWVILATTCHLSPRFCSLSSDFSECEMPCGAGGSLGAAGSREALLNAKWCLCLDYSRSIKALTSAVSQLNSVSKGNAHETGSAQ